MHGEVRLGSAYLILTYSRAHSGCEGKAWIESFGVAGCNPPLGKNRKGAIARALFLKPLGIDRTDYFCGRLAGGMMLFMRRYSTIWP